MLLKPVSVRAGPAPQLSLIPILWAAEEVAHHKRQLSLDSLSAAPLGKAAGSLTGCRLLISNKFSSALKRLGGRSLSRCTTNWLSFLAKDHRKMLRVQDFWKTPGYCVVTCIKKKKKKKEQNESSQGVMYLRKRNMKVIVLICVKNLIFLPLNCNHDTNDSK